MIKGILSLLIALGITVSLHSAQQPNIVVVFIDDMGWGDFSCFGNTEATTPNIDAMADEGLRFHQFYVASPICSPSRVAISTGQYPQRWQITSYLARRKGNNDRGVAHWLDPKAPMLSRFLKQAGYATGHFGKWHMGGQRDITNAPQITAYGFDESLTNFEGLGAKLLPLTEEPGEDGEIVKGRIWEDAERLGEPVEWMLRCEITGGFVDRALGFIDKAQEQKKPFFINLWPDDVHTPLFPAVDNWRDTKRGLYCAVLEEMDAQLGPLFDRLKEDPELRDNTIVFICSDNGPEIDCGSAGPYRGLKATLFEAGVRSPLIVWAPGMTAKSAAGSINDESIVSSMDIVPSLLKLTGIKQPRNVSFDGQELLDTFLGKGSKSHSGPLYFRRPPDRKDFRNLLNLPDLAMRDGKWKLLLDYDGSRPMLYNLDKDPGESKNLAKQHPERVQRMVEAALKWNASMPKDAGDPDYDVN
ncbi:MAG: sulfatase-like hydrolase/transferase [Puniceicoccaceae bacterium]